MPKFYPNDVDVVVASCDFVVGTETFLKGTMKYAQEWKFLLKNDFGLYWNENAKNTLRLATDEEVQKAWPVTKQEEHDPAKAERAARATAVAKLLEKQDGKDARKVLRHAMKMDYRESAARFLALQPLWFDRSGMWWRWHHTEYCWQMVDETDIMCIFDNNSDIDDTISAGERDRIKEALRRAARQHEPQPVPKTCIQFKDVLVDVLTGGITQATPDFMTTNAIPWTLGDTDATPIMDAIFKDWVGEQYVPTLYEIIAFCCIPDYFIHRIFVLIGRGSNGKSKYQDIISKFLGENNVCSSELDEIIRSRFESAKLFKRLACIMGETNFEGLRQTSKLKQLSGNDSVSFEFKNKTPFTAKNYAKLIINTNCLPTTSDNTDGFYRRWLCIEYNKQYTEAIDILATIPEEEYHNLARKVVVIAKTLLERRTFTNEGSIADRKQNYEEKSDPLAKWLKEQTIEDANGFIFCYELRNLFKGYCEQHGLRSPNDTELNRSMTEHNYEVRKKPRDDGESWIRAYCGVRLRGLGESKDQQAQLMVPNSTSAVSAVSAIPHSTPIRIGSGVEAPGNRGNGGNLPQNTIPIATKVSSGNEGGDTLTSSGTLVPKEEVVEDAKKSTLQLVPKSERDALATDQLAVLACLSVDAVLVELCRLRERGDVRECLPDRWCLG